MAIIGWPYDVEPVQTIICAICRKERSVSDVAAGLYDSEGNQLFSCNAHFLCSRKLITGWVDCNAKADAFTAELASLSYE